MNHSESTEMQGDFELGKRSLPGSWGQIVLITVFVVFTDFRHTHPALLWFFTSIILASNIFRFYLSIRQSQFYPKKRKHWITLFAPTIWVPAVAWGIMFFLVIRLKGLNHYATTVSLLIGSGMSAAIITSVTPNRRLALSFITFVLGFPAIALIMRMEPQSAGLVLIFITYYLFLAFQLKIHHQSFWEGVLNRERLTQERNRLQNVVNAIPGLVVWVGLDLKIRGLNRNYAQNYSGTVDEFLGKDLSYKNPDHSFIESLRDFIEASAAQSTFELPLSIQGARRWNLLVARKFRAYPESNAPPDRYR